MAQSLENRCAVAEKALAKLTAEAERLLSGQGVDPEMASPDLTRARDACHKLRYRKRILAVALAQEEGRAVVGPSARPTSYSHHPPPPPRPRCPAVSLLGQTPPVRVVQDPEKGFDLQLELEGIFDRAIFAAYPGVPPALVPAAAVARKPSSRRRRSFRCRRRCRGSKPDPRRARARARRPSRGRTSASRRFNCSSGSRGGQTPPALPVRWPKPSWCALGPPSHPPPPLTDASRRASLSQRGWLSVARSRGPDTSTSSSMGPFCPSK